MCHCSLINCGLLTRVSGAGFQGQIFAQCRVFGPIHRFIVQRGPSISDIDILYSIPILTFFANTNNRVRGNENQLSIISKNRYFNPITDNFLSTLKLSIIIDYRLFCTDIFIRYFALFDFHTFY